MRKWLFFFGTQSDYTIRDPNQIHNRFLQLLNSKTLIGIFITKGGHRYTGVLFNLELN